MYKQNQKLQNTNKKQNHGFSLIELLIVSALSIVLILTSTSLFLTSMLTNNKIKMEQEIKTEGNYALNFMKLMLRNAVSIETCPSSSDSITFSMADGMKTTFSLSSSSQIASSSTANGTFNLTSNNITTQRQNSSGTSIPIFNCFQSTNKNYYVNISFTMKKGPGTISSKNTVFENFSTATTLLGRNFSPVYNLALPTSAAAMNPVATHTPMPTSTPTPINTPAPPLITPTTNPNI